MTAPLIYLASGSPRRRALLNQIRIPHALVDVLIDETPLPSESAEGFVIRMALEKARAAADKLPHRDLPVLAADTDVVLEGQILGKPADEADALQMLRRLGGRSHRVLSAVALIWKGERVRISESRVRFRPLDEAEIQAYWRTGEPADKAGAYGIQGMAAAFIEHLEGSYSGVMGLPLFETAELLREAGLPLLQHK
ncbi:MAG: septum formation inhibitor Maf [Gammaproteobacteria bacterium]|nr:septum formation inhibitor Maf [Gammaproteobacteria bacterium]MBU1653946.1 septum formation inhibitor Maf [Gammaproteobacteria bacterium]MBU1962646.1 septum formation inhibitor Maf [Gammaproteobacteria bacterium]